MLHAMPLQNGGEGRLRLETNQDFRSDMQDDAEDPASSQHNLRRNRGHGEDLFLSLALTEADLAGGNNNPLTSTVNKRQSLPARSNYNYRLPTDDRPRSSGGAVGASQDQSFPTLDSAAKLRPRHNTLQNVRERDIPWPDHGRGTTPTPSRYASTSSRTPTYLSGHSPVPSHDRAPRDWPRSPELYHFGRRRAPSSTFSDANSRRQTRMSGYDILKGPGGTPRDQDATMLTPNTPIGQRRSDPETESIGSATAPSTVWDELDDLKSRIRNLEITGKAPSTSGAAMAQQSNERPRTATTAPTTISSSPQHVRQTSTVPSDVTVGGPAAANIHPLLHSALLKAKPLLSPPLYRSLEATAADALALAAMTGSSGPHGTAYSAASIISGVNVSERHFRRKADSMCRNLTDLCIALCEGKSDLLSPTAKSTSTVTRSFGETPPSRYARRPSDETEDSTLRLSPNRSFSRVDSRRSSLLGLGLNSGSTPREMPEQSPIQDSSPSQNHVDYAARYRPASNMRARTSRFDEQQDDPTIRAPSRAMTEVGQLRPRRSDGMQPRSPGLREALAAQRNSGIPEEKVADYSGSSSSDTQQDRTRGFMERHGPAASEAGTLPPSKRRRRITSLEQYSSSPITASPRLSGTPLRTTSLSRRRNLIHN